MGKSKMAASMGRRPFAKIFSQLINISHKNGLTYASCHYASSAKNLSHPLIVASEDSSTIVCWHPEPAFPYEHSKPLPLRREELEQGDSVLKVQYVEDYENRYRPTGPTNSELMSMFFTPKYQWLPRPRNHYRRKHIAKDRESV